MTEITAPKSAVTAEQFADEIREQLKYTQGVTVEQAKPADVYVAASAAVRRHLVDSWMKTQADMVNGNTKAVGYLSAEFLMGKQLRNALLNAGLTEQFDKAVEALGFKVQDVVDAEYEPGLGNGGLGRLAACFIDSLASLGVPAFGYGIQYKYGIFKQEFDKDGKQVETPDYWLANEEPWGHIDYNRDQKVSFGGEVVEEDGKKVWKPAWSVRAVPVDYMVPGYASGRVNTLRLWTAKSYDEFDLLTFNKSEYLDAVKPQVEAENISKILYPEDSTPQGKALRLEQQYFFVSASIHDAIRVFYPGQDKPDLTTFPDKINFQLNDTHPVIAVPELMRILIDEHGFEFEEAWEVTKKCFAYTCHTLLPEALEVWSVDLMGRLLPRHLELIYAINDHFLDEVREQFGNDEMRVRRMSIIGEHPERCVRMAYLATVAGSKVNGVAALHSQLLRDKVLPDFNEMWPDKFTNVTNGITPRRFVRLANRSLSTLISDSIGKGWVNDLDRLRELEPYAEDPEFRAAFRDVKSRNKERLTDLLVQRDGIQLPEGHMLDVMVKRLHEYKRQSLKVLHIVTLYNQIITGEIDPDQMVGRTVVFGAKAAPGYKMAKDTIHLINKVAEVVNNDERTKGKLFVAFPANYNVTLAEKLIPAADLSEQISLAGMEASGTGNMKFALNGALTIGTDDGANVEIREHVGDDNFFLFGMLEPEVAELGAKGYNPGSFYESDPRLKGAIDLIASGAFSGGDRRTFEPIVSNLLTQDRFMALADYAGYMDAQAKVEAYYRDEDAWTRSAILNVARCGYFSSDRSMKDYIREIWHTTPVM